MINAHKKHMSDFVWNLESALHFNFLVILLDLNSLLHFYFYFDSLLYHTRKPIMFIIYASLTRY